MNHLTLPAFAKINLCLEIVGKRADGMHEVATVLQTISLADWLHFRPTDQETSITLECAGMDTESDNLILRAANLLQASTRPQMGCDIFCEKNIPIAAGLGGGSSDAGVTLRALNELWGTHLTERELADLARQLGSDVPYFVYGGTVLGTGTGEEVQRLPPAPRHWVLLVPCAAESERKTAEMYGALEARHYSDGASAHRMAVAIGQRELPYNSVASAFGEVAAARWPIVDRALDALRAGSARAVALSGSGPSAFGLYDDEAAARKDSGRINDLGIAASVYDFIDASSPPERT